MSEELIYPNCLEAPYRRVSPYLKHVKGIVLNAGAGQ